MEAPAVSRHDRWGTAQALTPSPLPSRSFRADSNLTQLAAIRAGFGIGVCQVDLARRDPEIVRLFEKEFALPLETFVVMHENLKTTPRCRATFDALMKGLLAYIGR